MRQHPFFSPIGCSATLLLFVLLGAAVYFSGGVAFSPGELSAQTGLQAPLQGFRAHADFELDCVQCHTPWRGVEAARCENCHTDVAAQRQGGSGLHGTIKRAADCAACHLDHRGRDFDMTATALANFDHERTGFSLVRHASDYAGQPLTCAACHQSATDVSVQESSCSDCHAQAEPAFVVEHTAQFGGACLDCHDGTGQMANFDHSRAWPLEGQHGVVECVACHSNQVFAGTPTECEGCHAEPEIHRGLFGADCAACHTAEAWTPARLTEHTFPLAHGEQGDIECMTCHTTTYTEYTCYGCHEHEPARIERKHREEGIDPFELPNCAQCHPTGREEE